MTEAPTPSRDALQQEGNIRRDWLIVIVASIALLVVAGGVLWWNNTAFPSTGHSHGGVSAAGAAGQPGNPALPARVVEVTMLETDSGMKFEPQAIEVTKGEQVRFRITNRGMLDHEFVLATLQENLQHLEEMKKMPGMAHASQNSITLKPDASGEVLWQFTNAGNFDFSCLIPGHREAGMHGAIVVK